MGEEDRDPRCTTTRDTAHTASGETERTRKDADGRTKRRQLRYG